MKTDSANLIVAQNLKKRFPISRGIVGTILQKEKKFVHAVDGIDFQIKKGEILALVGESGSGKTTTAHCCVGLLPLTSGRVLIDGKLIHQLNIRERKALRETTQIIFQDPFESLNPRQTIFDIVAEPLEIHNKVTEKNEKFTRVHEALESTGLKPAETFFDRLPDELSGGQRQRVAIASALILRPKILVADEPVSMLDVSIRAEILNLLDSLRNNHGITILYITHDLATAAYIANRVAVMYLGKIVEIGPVQRVLGDPSHPYTRALKSVIPSLGSEAITSRTILSGETPDPIEIPVGCRFHPRCPEKISRCLTAEPALKEVSPGHYSACFLSYHLENHKGG